MRSWRVCDCACVLYLNLPRAKSHRSRFPTPLVKFASILSLSHLHLWLAKKIQFMAGRTMRVFASVCSTTFSLYKFAKIELEICFVNKNIMNLYCTFLVLFTANTLRCILNFLNRRHFTPLPIILSQYSSLGSLLSSSVLSMHNIMLCSQHSNKCAWNAVVASENKQRRSDKKKHQQWTTWNGSVFVVTRVNSTSDTNRHGTHASNL